MALLSGLRKTDAGPATNGDVVKDSDSQNFMKDVIEASRSQPVIVDFWAPWCGPCKQLGPIIERVVRAAGGKVRLVKINVDESPELAQQLRVQSIPMVYGFVQGQPVDGFAGALPESQIKTFVERLAGPVGPTPIEAGLEQAKAAVAAGQMDVARQIYERVLGAEPENPDALAGAARCHIASTAPVPPSAWLKRRGPWPIRIRCVSVCRRPRTITPHVSIWRPDCSCAARLRPRSMRS
jgi:putative thioredoxin